MGIDHEGQLFCGCTASIGSDGAKWGLKELSWCLAIPCMERDVQFRLMVDVFNHISSIVDLTFKHIAYPAKANLVYLAGRGAQANLDGPMGTLAYAYLPNSFNFKGQLNCIFDLDESWNKTIHFYNVMYHETLHLLGLDHSRLKKQLMSPTYAADIDKPQGEDKTRLQALYGLPSGPVIPTPTPTLTNSIIIDIGGVTKKGKIVWE